MFCYECSTRVVFTALQKHVAALLEYVNLYKDFQYVPLYFLSPPITLYSYLPCLVPICSVCLCFQTMIVQCSWYKFKFQKGFTENPHKYAPAPEVMMGSSTSNLYQRGSLISSVSPYHTDYLMTYTDND